MARELVNRYPVGVQSFDDIRRRDLVYVDKTAYVWDLAHQGGKAFFLSRPLRFGKSLLLSTMQAYFEGRRELFEGLAIEGLEAEWEASPVIRLDMSVVKATSVEGLMRLLDSLLRGLEEQFGLERADDMPGSRLAALIRHAAADRPASVVVLVDEYDAPLLNVIDDEDLLARFRQVMRELYVPLKACDEHLRFVFLAGITKFSQLSIFSELNNLSNISMEPRYAGICGITEDELRGQLAPDVAALANRLGNGAEETFDRLKAYFDGYHFCGDSPDVYNPFSLVSAFARERIGSYWFASGTPSSLLRLVSARDWQIVDLEGRQALETSFDVPIESMDTPLPMLYQSGYLTIKGYDPEATVYTLGIPNTEVSRGLAEGLVRLSGPGAFGERTRSRLPRAGLPCPLPRSSRQNIVFRLRPRSGSLARSTICPAATTRRLRVPRSSERRRPYGTGRQDEKGVTWTPTPCTPTPAASCVASTSARRSRSRAGSGTAATTAASSSWTCATATA